MFPLGIMTRPLLQEASNELIYNNRGKAYSNLNKHEEAVASYSEAIQLKSDYGKAYTNRAFSNYQLANYAEVIKDIDQVKAMNQADKILLLLLWYCQIRNRG